MNDQGPAGPGWTVVLRRQAVRIVAGQAEGGYTDEFEIICCDCGDDPGLDYREVSPALQQIRGPYPIATGITAYVQHARRHPSPPVHRQAAARCAEPTTAYPVADSPGSGSKQPGRGRTSSRLQHVEAIGRDLRPVDRR